MQSDAQNAEYPISAPKQPFMQAVFKFWSTEHYHRHLIPLSNGSSSSIWSSTRKKYNKPHIYEQSPSKHQPPDTDGRGQFAITPSHTHTHQFLPTCQVHHHTSQNNARFSSLSWWAMTSRNPEIAHGETQHIKKT